MKVVRYLGIGVGLVLAVLLLVVGGLYALFDGDKVKSELSRVMWEDKQRLLHIEGQPQLSVWPDVGVALGRVTLSERASKDTFVALDSARVSVALVPLLSRKVQVRGVELHGLQATVVKDKHGAFNFADLVAPSQSASPPAAHTQPAQPLQLDIASIKISDTQLTWRDEKAGSTLVLSHLAFRTGRVQGNAEALHMEAVEFGFEAQSGTTSVKGQVRSPVEVSLAAQTLVLGALTGKLEVASPHMPMRQLSLPLEGSVRVDMARQSAALKLGTQFDESKIAVQLTAAPLSPLALVFDLEVDRLNVDKYLPPPSSASAPTAPASGGREVPLDFSALNGLNLRGAARIGALQVSGIRLEHLRGSVLLAAGRLEVAPLRMQLYQGSAQGRLVVNAAGNRVALQQNLSQISIHPLMKDVMGKDLLEGRGDVQLDVSSQGGTVGAMKKALAGTAALSLKDGAIKGINLAQSLRDLRGKLSGQTDTSQPARAGEKTDFSELSASFKIANGVAHNEDLAMKSPFLRLSGAGDIDVGAGQMDYLAKATVVGSSEGQGGKNADQLKGLTVPVRVSGPFERLVYKLELASMVQDLTKVRVEEKKQEIQTQVEDRARELLKGILGR